MDRRILSLSDNVKANQKESLTIGGTSMRSTLKGHVEIFEKSKNGSMKLIDKQNTIVYGGREWLLDRAFGPVIEDSDLDSYKKVIRWFGCGVGGGEPGNPLQAGAALGQDTDLYQQIRLRTDLEDPVAYGHDFYASKWMTDQAIHGYFKKFSGVSKKEDHANPYIINNETLYPPLIAEIRIELSSLDANGSDPDNFQDLNEAALYVADPDLADPGATQDETTTITYAPEITYIERDINSYNTIYFLNTYDLASESGYASAINVGDFFWVSGTSQHNLIPSTTPLLITDIFNGEAGPQRLAYIVVEKADSVTEDPAGGAMIGHFTNRSIPNYIMFSRVTFSTIRKTIDREIVFLWKLYF